MKSLLSQFLQQDGKEYGLQKLLTAILVPENRVVMEFTFNRFNVHIDLEKGRVTVEDDLNVEPDGKCELKTEEFLAILRNAIDTTSERKK